MIRRETSELARQLFRRDKRNAWAGGAGPLPAHLVSETERALVVLLYAEQVDIWQDYWRDIPTHATCDLFYERARYDAHATCRAFTRDGGKLL